jgi:iron(III) transport system substrate-binding protein
MTTTNLRSRRTSGSALAGVVLVSLGLVSSSCAALGGGGGVSEDVSDTQRELYDQAVEAGGEVSVFIGTGSNTEMDQLIELFNEDFPDINVSYISGTGDEVSERLLTEKRSGLSNADVLMLGGLSAFQRIDDEGYLAEYQPEDVDLFEQEESSYIDGVAYSFASLYPGACFNPENVSEEEITLLETYDGWTDPVWKDRAALVNVDGFGYRFAMTEWVYGDESLGKPWLADLAALDPTVYTSGNIAVPQVIAGEYDVVFNVITGYGARAYRENAPLECITGEYEPYYTFAAALVDEAPNDAAGRLWLNWMFSERGQQSVQDTLSWTARREGFDAPVVDADWWEQTPEDPRLVQEDVVDENYDDLLKTFNDLAGSAEE